MGLPARRAAMKILVVHNDYGRYSGEERALDACERILTARGHTVTGFRRESATVRGSAAGHAKAFAAGIWNPRSAARLARLLDAARPDAVLLQNLYPLLSPAVLGPIRKRKIPLLMRCPNYRLFCPTGLHVSRDAYCERCVPASEYWCVLLNCERSLPKSLAYALRHAAARRFWRLPKRVDAFAVLSEHQRNLFAARGIARERLFVVPNTVAQPPSPGPLPAAEGRTVAYVGRIAPEKGIRDLLAAARRLPEIPFVLAGDIKETSAPGMRELPPNVRHAGFVTGQALERIHAESRLAVAASLCQEGFPNALVEAMVRGRPAVCTRVGSQPEIVRDARTGLLCEPGRPDQLADAIRTLHADPVRCTAMGEAARQDMLTRFSDDTVYAALMAAFHAASVACAAGEGT